MQRLSLVMTSCLNNSLLPAVTPAPVMTMIPMGTRPAHRPAPHQEHPSQEWEQEREPVPDLEADLEVEVEVEVEDQ
ncbi:hypothetical protein PS639_00043 [Pseudomonas fluorescens]|nr:hypothetical protein PS639_00043 [Pseudomonas fluorescens]